MNDELRSIAVAAGAPLEELDNLWFNQFCMRFADLLLTMADQGCFE